LIEHGFTSAPTFRNQFQGPVPPRGRDKVSRKSRFGWVQTHMSKFLDSGPKFTGLVSPNAEGIGLDHVSFRFWISCLLRRYSRSKSEVV